MFKGSPHKQEIIKLFQNIDKTYKISDSKVCWTVIGERIAGIPGLFIAMSVPLIIKILIIFNYELPFQCLKMIQISK